MAIGQQFGGAAFFSGKPSRADRAVVVVAGERGNNCLDPEDSNNEQRVVAQWRRSRAMRQAHALASGESNVRSIGNRQKGLPMGNKSLEQNGQPALPHL